MKKITIYIILFSCLLCGCNKQDIMDIPINADNFERFIFEIDKVCNKTDEETCTNIKGPIVIEIPEAINKNYKPIGDDILTANELYRRLNGKTPAELIQIYKGLLLNNLETVRKRDINIAKDLDIILASYESTKHYASYINVSDIKIIYDKNVNNMKLECIITNQTDFTIQQIVAEAEFYSYSDMLLGRTSAFTHAFNADLKPKGKAKIQASLDSIPEKDLILIRAAKNLKINVNISSIQTNNKNTDEKNIIISLPFSYYKMRELLQESELLYNDTVNKINKIDIKRGTK